MRLTDPVAAFRRLQAFRRDALVLFSSLGAYTEDVVEVDFGLRTSFVISEPSVALGILTSDAFDKGSASYGPLGTFAGFGSLRWLVGPSLPVLDGAPGLERRRALMPLYGDVLARFDAARQDAPLALDAVEGDDVDLYPVLSRAVFQRFCQTMFGRTYPEWADPISEAVSSATTSLDTLSKSWQPYAGAFGAASSTLQRCRGVIAAFADAVCADLEATASDTPMARLLREGLPADVVKDEILTQIVAGTETTTITTCWAMVELARSPRHVAQLRAASEPQALATAVAREALRMYPAFWTMIRVAREDVEVGGHRFPAGAVVFVSPFCIHHNPRFWPDPWTFDPGRYEGRKGVRGDYMPFGFGARSCIGGRLAQAIATECILEGARRLDLAFVDGEPEGPTIDPLIVVLKSRTGFHFRAARADRVA